VGKLDGKVAVVTGAGRGQGRAHAVRLAQEGADIIAVDICEPIETVPYDLSSAADLRETVALVEKLDRRIVASTADVRDRDKLGSAVEEGIAALGRLDIVVGNAGILSFAPFVDMSDQMYHDMIDVQLHGNYNLCKVTVPHLIDQGDGGSIILISSTAGMRGFPNQVHYNVAKHGVVGLMRSLANELAQHFIRVNTVHPSSVNTKMIQNETIWKAFAPDVENPTVDDFGAAFTALNLLPIPWLEPSDISGAVAWLASDDSRYVTGVTLPVDAGFLAKYS
jgi:SDR family mycofactocin-dependent oxidoreductase